jgi:hypothetical protein
MVSGYAIPGFAIAARAAAAKKLPPSKEILLSTRPDGMMARHSRISFVPESNPRARRYAFKKLPA